MSLRARLATLARLVPARTKDSAAHQQGHSEHTAHVCASLRHLAGEGPHPGPMPPAAASWLSRQPQVPEVSEAEERALMAQLRRMAGEPADIAGGNRTGLPQ